MKKIIFFLLATAPFSGDSQTINYYILKQTGGMSCDTCFVNNIFNIETPVSYVFIDAIDEYVSSEGPLYIQSGAGIKNMSKHFTSSGRFTLNFLPRNMSGINDPYSTLQKQKIPGSYKKLQFRVWKNKQANSDWRDISSLPKDTNSVIFYNIKGGNLFKDVNRQIEWPEFSAGVYKLNINDSLTIRIRETINEEIVQTIFIKRIESLPKFFDFIQFPDTSDLQSILNIQLNTSSGFIADSINELEISPGYSGLLRFGIPTPSQDRTIEYAWSDMPSQWHELTKGKTLHTLNPFLFIYIKKTSPSKHLELLIRYKHQPESIRRIKIKVRQAQSQISWIKIGASFMLAFCLFGVLYYFNRKKNKKQLSEIIRKKEDIETKLQFLTGQLNPHFLFNSLNAIQGLINKNEPEKANIYVTEVATFMRTIMDTSRKEFISLEEEIRIEESYIQLEQKRNPFQYKICNKCNHSLSEIEFPALLLQPVIENSIRHGLKDHTSNSIISIEIDCNSNNLIITITDNGSGFNSNTVVDGHGLFLIRKRISLLNEKLDLMNITMNIHSEEAKGAVTIFMFKNWLK